MVTRIILKLMFKAMVPLVCLMGVMSYGMYTMGGDPGALFKKVISGSMQSAKSSVQDAGDSIKALPSKVSSVPQIGSGSKTTIYSWVDENGVKQFGSKAPEGIASSAKTYDNNANLMVAQPPPKIVDEMDLNQLPAGFGANGERLPGMAGMNLPTNVDPATAAKLLQVMQGQH